MTLNLYQKNIPELLELDRIELNEEGKAASLCFLRAQRFIEGFCVEKEITELYIKFEVELKKPNPIPVFQIKSKLTKSFI